ncbi:mevalonate kinase [Neoconidiobolus thromboides FSU 785]|nr:mevalonate kinase [Neoconidiobolus thromboides FSU 785]
MEPILCSSPGKIILFGEHAVVYGKKAIAGSIDLRTYGLLLGDDGIQINCPDINLNLKVKLNELPWSQFESYKKLFNLNTIIEDDNIEQDIFFSLVDKITIDPTEIESLFQNLLLKEYSLSQRSAVICFYFLITLVFDFSEVQNNGFKIQINSRIPVGAGLGSSASFSVTLCTLLLSKKWKKIQSLNETMKYLINKISFLLEKIIHGNPSGLDNTVSCYGGFLSFKNLKFENLKCSNQFNILISNTKIPRNTKILVQNVFKLYQKYPSIIQPILDSIDNISNTFEKLLKESNNNNDNINQQLKDLIPINQQLLKILTVSHEQIEKIIELSQSFDIVTKLTGAGGGGCTISILDDNSTNNNKLIDSLIQNNIDVYPTTLAGKGVTFHCLNDNTMNIINYYNQLINKI